MNLSFIVVFVHRLFEVSRAKLQITLNVKAILVVSNNLWLYELDIKPEKKNSSEDAMMFYSK